MPFLQQISRSLRSMMGNDSPMIERLRPMYARFLSSAYGDRGIPWRINGQRFRVDPSYRARLGADYDADIARVLSQRVKSDQCCFDIGANVGVYALQFAGWTAPRGTVHAFEPNPQARDVLERHVAMNGLNDRVRIVPKAIGDTAGEVTFTAVGNDGMSRVGTVNPLLAGRDQVRELRVQRTTIDDYCDTTRVDPDWLFLDIEGHEIAALRGARRLIARRGSALQIAVELHPSAWSNAGSDEHELQQLLADFGRVARNSDGKISDLNVHHIVFLSAR